MGRGRSILQGTRSSQCGGAGGATAGGSVTRTVVPRPTSLSMAISPRASFTMDRETDRPRPVPSPAGLVVTKGSKTRPIRRRRDAGAGVRHLDHHAAPVVDPRARPDLVAAGVSLGDGVGRVDEEVQEDLAEARLVDGHRRHLAVVAHDARPPAQLAPGDAEGVLEHLVDVDGADQRLVRAGEPRQVEHDGAHAGGALAGHRRASRGPRQLPGERREPPGRARVGRCAASPSRRAQSSGRRRASMSRLPIA